MAIEFKKVSYTYKGIKKELDQAAIKDIDLKIGENEFVAICGKTGSGKSTMIHHMNALMIPTEGEVTIFDKVIVPNKRKNKKLKQVRKNVGLVFQFPEYQLFEETVLKDIMFGPLNFGVKKEEALAKAKKAASLVGLSDEILEKSPFKLSGGQMRRAAIAGILAMEPKILVLDEPTRGLDPQGSVEMMDLFMRIHNEENISIVLITHDMDIISKYAKRVVVMKDGMKVYDGSKEELFECKEFNQFHLRLPSVIKAIDYLNDTLHLGLSRRIYTLDDLLKELKKNG